MSLKKLFLLQLLLFLSFLTTAQQIDNKYEKQWKKIDSLITKKGLTQSALVEVNKLYELAKKESNNAQLIKALVYRMSLVEMREEDATKKNIGQLEKEITSIKEPARSVLQSILAETYWLYFQQHRWQLYNRTATVNFKKDDIATWGVADFHRKISDAYLVSIANEGLLQQTRLEPFDAIIIKGNARHLRPTLYDLLAHRSLDYFKNDERNIDKPAYAFQISEPAAFAEAKTFVAYRFVTKDSISLHHKALQLFQQLISFHLSDLDPSALIDLDIERVQFVNSYGVMENKDSLYNLALHAITQKYPNENETAQAWYLIAEIHAEKAKQYDALKDTSNRYEYITAKNICETVVTRKDSSEGKFNCQRLLQEILRKEVNLQTEKVNVPNQPFRTLISYRNFSQLNYRVVKVDRSIRESFENNRWEDEYWQRLVKLPALRTISQSLPETNDHQLHRVETKIDALPFGEYALIGSLLNDFSLKNNSLVVQFFHVSNLAYINNVNDYFVLNRESGQPVASSTIQVWERRYDYQKQRNVLDRKQQLSSDKNGFFRVVVSRSDRRMNPVQIELTTATDHLFISEDSYVPYRYSGEEETTKTKEQFEKDNKRVFLFTDRSIYRPGQTVFFKGITVTKDFETRKYKIVPNLKTKIFLYDANGEKVDSVAVTTNEFGSYSGKFRLPENRLNGEFRIDDDASEGEASFSVEEYKRPKFYVDYEKLKGTYRLYDTIEIKGIAKAYAGNNISGATVRYRVYRQARFPYPWLYWRWGYPVSEEQEITHGEIQTDVDGKFIVRFAALPDKKIKKEFEPVFEYKVIADVTDMNGETRTGETVVRVSYKALQLSVTVLQGETLRSDSLKQILIKTTNLAGEFEPAKVTLSIYRLDAPKRLIRQRYWEQADQFVMTREEYLKNFPYDEYSDETKKEGWARIEKVHESSDSTKSNSQFEIRNPKFSTGWYAIEVTTTDKYGQPVKDIKYVQLTDPKTGQPGTPDYAWNFPNTHTAEPGTTVKLDIGSSAESVFLIQTTDQGPRTTLNPGQSRRAELDPEQSRKAGIDPERSRRANLDPERSRRSGTDPERSRRGDDNKAPSGVEELYKFYTLNNENKSFTFPVTEADRGGFAVSHAFVKHNRFYTSTHTIIVPWTNKDLAISYETYRDRALPGSQETWKVKISGYKNEKIATELLTSMYDASLDQFRHHNWHKPSIWPVYFPQNLWNGRNNFTSTYSQEKNFYKETVIMYQKKFDQLKVRISTYEERRMYSNVSNEVLISASGRPRQAAELSEKDGAKPPEDEGGLARRLQVPDWKNDPDGSKGLMKDSLVIPNGEPQKNFDDKSIQIRKNFNETAFFFPDLKTDSAGNISFSFTLPEALTQWKWMLMAHTRDLAFGYSEKTIITQKELMVQPNLPRFLREGDRMELSAKIVNMTDKELTGQVELQVLDATSNQPVDGWFQNMYPNQFFTTAAGQSSASNFSIQIPFQFNKPVVIRLIARSGNISDGEENTVTVLTNRMLVTETLPITVSGSGTKTVKFEKLLNSISSETLNHHAVTVEYTSNPAWYAVQALPYLMEFPYECSEQVWNRFYANALASKIANSSPRIKEIFEKWKAPLSSRREAGGEADTSALLSNLEKNQELKSLLLQETPWVMEAKNETEQKKRIALLFDMMRMSNELEKNLDQLRQMQTSNGGFVWFKGGPDDRYITQYIISGIGHLKKLDAIPATMQQKIKIIVDLAIPYLDKKLKEDYDNMIKLKGDLTKNQLGYNQVNYLYMRSFFMDYNVPGNIFNAYNYYRKQSQQFWLQHNKYMQGMIGLSLHRTGDIQTAKNIIASLEQNAIKHEELGMYWKDMSRGGYYWYEAPIETQALLIEAFNEITKNMKSINALKTWLLKNKQTNNWRTTKATADACYALLLQGTNWLVSEPMVEIKLGDKGISSSSTSGEVEAGTGYFKKVFDASSVNAGMGNISVTVSSPTSSAGTEMAASWGAVYWQYFENLENITHSSTPLQLTKKLFIERNSDRGPVLEPIGENAQLKVGDKVKVRIELKVDRNMEYVHMKDMRAASLEPVNVISSYKWQGGLGYYESTKDASTNFFFNYLPRGTYVFEYPLFATHTGTFSNGITSIQCMYAPEFASHSEGVKINVE